MSPIVIHNGTVYLSGQVPDLTKLDESDIVAQTQQTLAKVDDLLAQAGYEPPAPRACATPPSRFWTCSFCFLSRLSHSRGSWRDRCVVLAPSCLTPNRIDADAISHPPPTRPQPNKDSLWFCRYAV